MYSASDVLVKPVLDISQPTDIRDLKLGTDSTLTPVDVTFTGQEIIKQVLDGVASMEDMQTILSDIVVAPLMGMGNDTNYDKTLQWKPDGDIFIYKCILRAAVAVNVSAYTSGNIDLDKVEITLTIHDQNGNQVGKPFLEVVAEPTFTVLTGTGALIFIIDDVRVPQKQVKVIRNNSVRLNIKVTGSKTGTATYQAGILPLFKFHAADGNMLFTESVLRMFTKSAIDNAYPIIRDESKTAMIDYSGVTRDQISRAALVHNT